MIIERKSPLTGEINKMDIPLTDAEIAELNSANRRSIQDVLPNCTPDQREFIMTGFTPEDWKKMFSDAHDPME